MKIVVRTRRQRCAKGPVLGTEDTLTVDDWFASESHASLIRDANGARVDTAAIP